ncbi:CAP domain-containing protein [Streptomyces sp. MNU76]|uniref:CAP domain-containing protein n=1 Tax=Streptomyces sp. MNU76 TaxID=2560026 RepID=UPI001E620E88|nr:CAP domain-containing protein [Streptomyces sp. MNU76]MCC9706871.1 CAP domain-containing protein [Streptomyces sp. MNU76]
MSRTRRTNSHRRRTKRSAARQPRSTRRKIAVATALVVAAGAVGIPAVAWVGGVGPGDWSSVASSWWGGQKADADLPEPSRTPSASATPSAESTPDTPESSPSPSRSKAKASASPSKSASPKPKSTPEAAKTPARTTPPPAPKATQADRTPATSSGNTASGPTAQVLNLVNAERQKAGCSPVTVDAKLTKAAQDHSQDMAAHQNMSHTGSDGSDMSERLSRVGYSFRSAGENVAAGYGTAASVMDGWMNSPGHRANILNCGFKEIGIGLAQPGNYWTQNFGTPA